MGEKLYKVKTKEGTHISEKVDDVVPEQISYLKVEKKLKELLNEGKSIKDLIHILEELEEECIG